MSTKALIIMWASLIGVGLALALPLTIEYVKTHISVLGCMQDSRPACKDMRRAGYR